MTVEALMGTREAIGDLIAAKALQAQGLFEGLPGIEVPEGAAKGTNGKRRSFILTAVP